MFDRLADLRSAVCAAAAAFEPAVLDRDAAARAVAEWTAVINAASAARAMAVARIAECGPPPGSPDAASWFASATGTTAAKARESIDTGRRLRRQTTTRSQATGGRLSPEQAAAVADAAAANPEAEARLNEHAERSSLSELRDECARAKAAADADPAATQRRIHQRRSLRRWRDKEGAEHLHACGTRDDLARIDQALAPLIDQIFEERRAGDVEAREPFDAYAFDALCRLAGSGQACTHDKAGNPKLRYLALLRVDVEALQRGRVESDDELCEITGLGPIPVATARALLGESVLKLVITKGVDVLNVTHLGRGANVAQQVALLWQQPLCTREGCGRRHRVQNDHRDEWARVRRTELHNLDPLCSHDHALKTYAGWALVEGTGTRPMVPPDDPRHPRHRARPP